MPIESPIFILKNLTIANGASLSDETGDTRGFVPVAIITPDTLAGTVFSFQVSHNGTNFANLYYDNNGTSTELTVALGTARHIALDPHVAKFMGGRAFKVRSGTSGSPSNQNADRVITLVLRAL